jgi:hypothetical protein
MRCFYFAYGSNLHPVRLQERVPSARLVGTGVLPGHDVLFGKRGMDGSGKCSVARGVGSDDGVHGALFEMLRHERGVLDAAEGPDYARKHAAFALNGVTVNAFYYEAKVLHVGEFLPPFYWYRELVLAGARFNALPDAYVRGLAAAECMPDPDEVRARRMDALLTRLSAT